MRVSLIKLNASTIANFILTHFYTFNVTLSLSYIHFHTFTLSSMLSSSQRMGMRVSLIELNASTMANFILAHFYTFNVTLSLSYIHFHFHTFFDAFLKPEN